MRALALELCAQGEIDWLIHKAKGLPGPGEYEVGKRKPGGGGRFNMSNPKSDIEVAAPRVK